MLIQNRGNSVSGDLKCKNFLGGCPQTPLEKDWLRRSIITVRLLRNFFPAISKVPDNPVFVLAKYCITCGRFPCFQKAI